MARLVTAVWFVAVTIPSQPAQLFCVTSGCCFKGLYAAKKHSVLTSLSGVQALSSAASRGYSIVTCLCQLTSATNRPLTQSSKLILLKSAKGGGMSMYTFSLKICHTSFGVTSNSISHTQTLSTSFVAGTKAAKLSLNIADCCGCGCKWI